eukprot:m.47665 g.47665  ORF g.47665 m.47665 type:complete len:55 (+) comp20548_c0_seq1:336-500(+)
MSLSRFASVTSIPHHIPRHVDDLPSLYATHVNCLFYVEHPNLPTMSADIVRSPK